MSEDFWEANLPPSDNTEDQPGSDKIEIHSPTSIGALFGGWAFTGIWCSVSFLALIFIGGPALADLGTSGWTPTDGVVVNSGVD